jgi:hypothetical protein
VGGHRRREVDQPRERTRHAADHRVREVGPVEGDHVRRPAHGERAPAGQPVVGVHHVEALARVAAAQLARGGDPARAPARVDREDLDLDAAQRAQ